MRADDTAARLGGDEFAVLLEDVERRQDGGRVAERILDALAHADASSTGARSSSAPASASPIAGPRRAAADADELLRNADVAMYIAKRDGKGGYRVFEQAMHAGVLERLELRADLQRAIDADQFELHYQPIVRLDDGACLGRRGAAALAPPDARPDRARRVHPARRGDGPDRADRPLGAARGLPPGRRSCRRVFAASQPLTMASTSRSSSSSTATSSPTSGARSSDTRHRPATLDARDHREPDDGRRRLAIRAARAS